MRERVTGRNGEGADVATYRAARSSGLLWLGLLGWPVVFVSVYALLHGNPGSYVHILTGVAGFAVACVFIVPFLWYPTMRYQLGRDKLVLRCGLVKYVIRLDEILNVEKRNLTFSPLSSFRLPGFALGQCLYGEGTVRMCATRSHRGIVVVRTEKESFGLTPAEEARFVADLQARVEGKVSVSPTR